MSKFIHSIGRDNYYDIVDDQVNPINQKLNEILNLLHKINDQINAPPQTPKNLPIRSPMLPLPSPPIDLQKKKEIPFEKPLPPPPLDILDSEIESGEMQCFSEKFTTKCKIDYLGAYKITFFWTN